MSVFTENKEVGIVAAEDSECHPALLTSGEALDLLQGHVARHTELAQHPPVVLNLLPGELPLHHLHRTHSVVYLINKMLPMTKLIDF